MSKFEENYFDEIRNHCQIAVKDRFNGKRSRRKNIVEKLWNSSALTKDISFLGVKNW
jgi:hypothetical protein